ncbi:unnamed protein product [Gadus morhua 'NCC']
MRSITTLLREFCFLGSQTKRPLVNLRPDPPTLDPVQVSLRPHDLRERLGGTPAFPGRLKEALSRAPLLLLFVARVYHAVTAATRPGRTRAGTSCDVRPRCHILSQ